MPISLAKGQKISLEKESGMSLSRVVMGLGWDAAAKTGFWGRASKSIDLDASCILFDENRTPLDIVWFRQLQSRDGSITHTGDNLTGAGSGDDEQIIVDLNRVSPLVKSLVFTVNSFRGQTFNEVANAYCRILNAANNAEIARYALTGGGPHTAMIMAKVYRHNNEWKMHAIGEPGTGQTVQALIPSIQIHL